MANDADYGDLGVDPELLHELGYEPTREPLYWRCPCGMKIYVGGNPTDFERHELSCEYR